MDSSLIAALAGLIGILGTGVLSAIASYLSARAQKPPDVSMATGETAKDVPIGIQQIAKVQLEISNNYYKIVLQQSKQSFVVGVIFGSVGLTFFITSVILLIFVNVGNVAYVSLIGGTLTELISAVNFYLYGRASNQLETFHIRLDKTQLIILADSVCESLSEDMKSQTRADLVVAIANSLLINSTPELQIPKRKASKAKAVAKSQQAKDGENQDEG